MLIVDWSVENMKPDVTT